MPSRTILRKSADPDDALEILARKLAGETLCHVQTARKYVRGEPVRGIALRDALDAAAKKLRASDALILQPTG